MNLESLKKRIVNLSDFQPELKPEHPSVFASLLIIFSGLILYLDKVFKILNITFTLPAKFENTDGEFSFFIWVWAQTLSPLFLILGTFNRPYRVSYLVPIFCYSVQIYFLAFDYELIDDSYIFLYFLGTFTIILIIFKIIAVINKYRLEQKINAAKKRLKKKK